MVKRISNYDEFWQFYLAEHTKPWTKKIHALGLILGLAFVFYAIASSEWVFLPLALLVSYGPIWMSHFFIEKNKPASFKYPFWSFISEFRMVYLFFRGKL